MIGRGMPQVLDPRAGCFRMASSEAPLVHRIPRRAIYQFSLGI